MNNRVVHLWAALRPRRRLARLDALAALLLASTEQLLLRRADTAAFIEWAGIWDAVYDEHQRIARPWWRSFFSLARVKGWGSAGQCPAPTFAKTPAVRESARRVAALARKGREDLAGANAQRPDPVGVSS